MVSAILLIQMPTIHLELLKTSEQWKIWLNKVEVQFVIEISKEL